jgi:hypothetical protein
MAVGHQSARSVTAHLAKPANKLAQSANIQLYFDRPDLFQDKDKPFKISGMRHLCAWFCPRVV